MDNAAMRVLCPHCGCLLSKKTFSTHKRLYYDESSGVWIEKRSTKRDDDDESLMDVSDFDLDISDDEPVTPKGSFMPAGAPPLVDFDSDDDDEAVKGSCYSVININNYQHFIFIDAGFAADHDDQSMTAECMAECEAECEGKTCVNLHFHASLLRYSQSLK